MTSLSPGRCSVDALQLRVAELEDVVKRKNIALKASNHRRERVQETAKVETTQARLAAELVRSALDEAGRKGSSLRERAQDAEARVRAHDKVAAYGVTFSELVPMFLVKLWLWVLATLDCFGTI